MIRERDICSDSIPMPGLPELMIGDFFDFAKEEKKETRERNSHSRIVMPRVNQIEI